MTPLVETDVVYYLFLSQFGIPPSVVDEMDCELVYSMVSLHGLVKEHEEKMMKEASRGR